MDQPTKTYKFWLRFYEIEHSGDVEREEENVASVGGRVLQSEADYDDEDCRLLVEASVNSTAFRALLEDISCVY